MPFNSPVVVACPTPIGCPSLSDNWQALVGCHSQSAMQKRSNKSESPGPSLPGLKSSERRHNSGGYPNDLAQWIATAMVSSRVQGRTASFRVVCSRSRS